MQMVLSQRILVGILVNQPWKPSNSISCLNFKIRLFNFLPNLNSKLNHMLVDST
jgi:hypothetical protein